MTTHFIEKKKSTAYADSSSSADVQPSNVRTLFTHETGQVLETIGKMFVNIPPFNDHIDQNTGKLLISIGKKLKRN
ncbi:MAG: hypothetical protein HOP27_17750 [Anaerolineales bacterium]|nr:hypothetical protein [Anaerolineales bacterium]